MFGPQDLQLEDCSIPSNGFAILVHCLPRICPDFVYIIVENMIILDEQFPAHS